MRKLSILAFLMLLLAAGITFTACEEDDPKDEPKEADLLTFAITNAGAEGNERIDGAIDGLNVTVTVPYETDVTALIPEMTVSEGATVTPASGTALDFTEPRNFVVQNGDVQNTYAVTVVKAEPTAPTLLGLDVNSATTEEAYDVEVDAANTTVTVTFNDLQSTTVVVSNVEVAPDGATYTLSSTTDTLDLSADQTITVAYAGNEVDYTVTANITQAGFNPDNTTTLFDKSAASQAVPTEIADNASRGADFNGQYVAVASRLNGNHVYYWDINATVDEIKELELGTVVSGGTFAVSDVKFVGEAIYVSNMVMEKDQVFRVYKWDNVDDTEPEIVLEYTIGDPTGDAVSVRLGDALSIVGDPAADGYIMASNFPFNNPQNQIYVWKADGGTFGEPVVWDIQNESGNNLGQYGIVNGVPGEPDRFIVTGAELGITVVDADGNSLYEVPVSTQIQGRAYDPHVFEYNGGVYLSYVVNREWEANGAFYEIVNITAGEDIVSRLQNLTDENIESRKIYNKNFSADADAWISSRHAIAFDENGDPLTFAFTTLNGFIVEKLSK